MLLDIGFRRPSEPGAVEVPAPAAGILRCSSLLRPPATKGTAVAELAPLHPPSFAKASDGTLASSSGSWTSIFSVILSKKQSMTAAERGLPRGFEPGVFDCRENRCRYRSPWLDRFSDNHLFQGQSERAWQEAGQGLSGVSFPLLWTINSPFPIQGRALRISER